MNSHRAQNISCLAIVFSCLLVRAGVAADATEDFQKQVRPLLQTYCFDCHADGMKQGNVAFDQLKTNEALLDPHLWFNALKNVRAGLMPADGSKLKPEELKTLETWIKRDVFKLDPANPDPGRVTLRRLNRTEYKNTIRDLMGYDFNVEEEFPPDDTGYGFDTIGDVLSVSPMLLEKYMRAAEQIVPAAVGLEPRTVPEYVIPGSRFISGVDAPAGGRGGGGGGAGNTVSFGTGGTFTQKYSVQRAGQYRIQVTMAIAGAFDFDPGKAKIAIKSDNDVIQDAEYGWSNGKETKYEFVGKFEPGDHEVTFIVTPVADASVPQIAQALPEELDAQALAAQQEQQAAQAVQGARGGRGGQRRSNIDLRINNVRITGPIDQVEHWKVPEKYSRFFTRAEPPKAEAERREYAAEVLGRFGALAFRRPLDATTLNRVVTIAQTAYSQPGKQFEQGIQYAMIAMLSAPRFIFRIEETTPTSKDDTFGSVDEFALASRLSYFLWSTMPDAQLFDLAKRGELRKNLDAQVKRMLADPRSEAFVTNFSGQWLQIRDIDNIPIDGKLVVARDNGTEAQLKAEEEAARAARGARGNRGNRGQLGRGQIGQQPPAPNNANPQAAPDAAQQPPNQNPQAPAAQPAPQQGQANPQQPAAVVAAPADAQPAPAAVAQVDPQANPQQAPFAGRGAGRGRGGRRGQPPVQDPNAPVQNPAAAQQPQNLDPQAVAQLQQPAAAAGVPNAQPNPVPGAQVAQAATPDAQAPNTAAANGAAPQGVPQLDPAAAAAARGAAFAGARGNRGNLAGNRGGRGGRGGGPPADELDPQLRKAMRQETEMYFGRIVHEDRSVLELIDSNWTFLNERLAYHYRIPDVTGTEMRLVTLPEGNPRGGVLTQGAILSVTSNPTRTSPVKRGLFILDNILGTPPPPPPNDVPPFEDAEKQIDGHEPTVRETLELHRNSALCKSCHARMDPLGLALENFNAMGMWREKERNQQVEVKGQLATGEPLGSPKDLKQVIVKEHRADYYRTLSEKLLTYALGRGTEYYDVETIDQIVQKLESSDGKFSALLMGVIDSAPFQKRRNTTAASATTRPVAQAN